MSGSIPVVSEDVAPAESSVVDPSVVVSSRDVLEDEADVVAVSSVLGRQATPATTSIT
jgi:hypothetical protein